MCSKSKILYVDDEIINLEILKFNLSDKYEVFTADEGIKGLDVLDNNPDISVIFSDLRMPNMDGFEFITKAKSKFPDIKIFILTGFNISKEIQAAIDTKLILQCLRKPFDMNQIELAIANAIG